MRWIAMTMAGLLLMHAKPGLAEVIHRCRTTSAEIVYQQTPCGALRSAGERHYTPEPDSAPLDVGRSTSKQAGRSATRGRASAGVARRRLAGSGEDRIGSCASVRAQRDAWERRVGLSRTYADLRHWTDAVARACP